MSRECRVIGRLHHTQVVCNRIGDEPRTRLPQERLWPWEPARGRLKPRDWGGARGR